MGVLYNSIKKEVNELGAKYAVKGSMKDRKGNNIKMDRVGISTGVYIPGLEDAANNDEDWLSVADKVALENAKKMNMPQKNGVAVYYAGQKRVVSTKEAEWWKF